MRKLKNQSPTQSYEQLKRQCNPGETPALQTPAGTAPIRSDEDLQELSAAANLGPGLKKCSLVAVTNED